MSFWSTLSPFTTAIWSQASSTRETSQAIPNTSVSPYGVLFQVVAQLLRPGRMAQLRQCLGLDLPDALARDAELLADLFQRPRIPIGQSEPQLDDLLLPIGQRVQDRVELFLQQDERRGVDRHDRVGVLDEVTEVR